MLAVGKIITAHLLKVKVEPLGEKLLGYKILEFILFPRQSIKQNYRKETDGCNSSITFVLDHHVYVLSSDNNQFPALSSCCRELLVVTGGYSWNSILA